MQSGPERLRDWMRRAKLTQAETARLLAVDQPTMTRIVNGVYRPGLTTAARIEAVTGIPARAWVDASELESESEPVAATAGKRRIVK